MSLPIARLVAAATARGLSQTAPILLSTDGGVAEQRVNIIVSYTEPTNVVAPLDLLWINPTSLTTLRRVSRANSQAYTHTWTDATESNFWTPQIWDEPMPSDQSFRELNRNVGNPFFLETSDIDAVNQTTGGTMLGPLKIRVDASIDNYADQEAIPKTLVKKLTDAAQAVAASVYQQMASIKSQITSIRNRVTAAEKTIVIHTDGLLDHDARIKTLEEADPSNPGTPGTGLPNKIFTQEEAALEWAIEHKLGTEAVIVQIYLTSGEFVMPDVMEPVDEDNYRVTFAEARAGTAVLVGIR